MKPGHPHICLYQPEIPQNVGNIGRLAAVTQSRLHLIKPLGFATDDRQLLRAGLDYWPFLDLELHDDFAQFSALFPGQRLAFLSKHGKKSCWDIPDDCSIYVFGRETSGLPAKLRDEFSDSLYHVPMYHERVRSLNLANTVAAVVYQHLSRQRVSHGHRAAPDSASGIS